VGCARDHSNAFGSICPRPASRGEGGRRLGEGKQAILPTTWLSCPEFQQIGLFHGVFGFSDGVFMLFYVEIALFEPEFVLLNGDF
jgi:hypothetical protein